MLRILLAWRIRQINFKSRLKNAGIYIRWESAPTSIGGGKQVSISGGVNPPSDIASGRAHIVRWTMVLRRSERSVDAL